MDTTLLIILQVNNTLFYIKSGKKQNFIYFLLYSTNNCYQLGLFARTSIPNMSGGQYIKCLGVLLSIMLT